MSLTQNGLIPQAQIARELASSAANTEIVLLLAVAATLKTAITSGLFTTTQSVTGKAAVDIQQIMNMLENLGYTVALAGTTLTISW